jgi:hypothetical protein
MPPTPLPPEHLRIGPILRDIAIVVALTFFGGCIVGFMHANSGEGGPPIWMLALSNLALGTIGFTISAALAPPSNRWKHLAFVAAGAWLFGLVNLYFGISISQWFASGIFIGILMGVGGAIGTLIRPSD